MKKKSKNFIYLFLLLGLLIFFTNSCKKDDIPTLTTKSISSITKNSAICGGNITFDGNSSVIARGVCWSTNTNPTVSDSKTIDGSGTGSFVSTINGLSANTTYYVKAYATNSFGTAYGNVVSFKTLDNTFTDTRDGKVYKTVKIGTQTWMAENLAYLPSVTGPDYYSLTNPNYYVNEYYGSDVISAKTTSNYTNYGVLYNWPAALTACPPGWHLPSNFEWLSLSNFLGGNTVSGGKLKEEDYLHWNSPNTGATNEVNFSARGGGYRDRNSTFNSPKNNGYWWTTLPYNDVTSVGCGMWYDNVTLGNGHHYNDYGFSVRCVMD